VISRFGVPALDDATAWLGLFARYAWRLCHGVGVVKALCRASTWVQGETRMALLTCSVMPRVRHFSHVGVVWSQRILEMRQGSHDLGLVSFIPMRARCTVHRPGLPVSPQHVVSLHAMLEGAKARLELRWRKWTSHLACMFSMSESTSPKAEGLQPSRTPRLLEDMMGAPPSPTRQVPECSEQSAERVHLCARPVT
jgi:hypothetical protein